VVIATRIQLATQRASNWAGFHNPISRTSSQSLGNWQTVGWPVNVTLPYSGPLHFGAPTPVSGSFAVQAGNSAALGFIYGTIVSVASGYVQFLWGNFGTRRTLPPAQSYGAKDFDKIEYRFEPKWWLKAVSDYVRAIQ
jgi:hypothetical protein